MPWNLPPDRSGMGGVFGASQEGMPGNRLYPGVKDMRSVGAGETIANALNPHEPWGVRSALMALMSAMPGMGRPTATMPKGPMYQPNNYVEPPPAANGIKPFEHERFRRKLVDLIPITSKNETQAKMLQSRMREVDAMPENNYWGQSPSRPMKPNPLTTDLDEMYGAPSPQEKARLLGIRLVDPSSP